MPMQLTTKLRYPDFIKPACPYFSSGPCKKHPNYQLAKLNDRKNILGRFHRSELGQSLISEIINKTKKLLEIPKDYRVAIVPASDTGAMEMAIWSLFGERCVDVFAWDAFGKRWLEDIRDQLKIPHKTYLAEYGQLPDFSQANPEHDVIFTWNGTAAGACVPNAGWIADKRTGLTICDAVSAVFAQRMPWEKLDVTTFSWQKVLGGEAGHGIIVLSERAVDRLKYYTPTWPMPKIFQLTEKGNLIDNLFATTTINTPSMLALLDYLDALQWIDDIGGLDASIDRCNKNIAVINQFVASNDWLDFLVTRSDCRSNTSACLSITEFNKSPQQIAKFTNLLADAGVAFDIQSHPDAPCGLRIWCGTTIEQTDLAALMPWLTWAFEQTKQSNTVITNGASSKQFTS